MAPARICRLVRWAAQMQDGSRLDGIGGRGGLRLGLRLRFGLQLLLDGRVLDARALLLEELVNVDALQNAAEPTAAARSGDRHTQPHR